MLNEIKFLNDTFTGNKEESITQITVTLGGSSPGVPFGTKPGVSPMLLTYDYYVKYFPGDPYGVNPKKALFVVLWETDAEKGGLVVTNPDQEIFTDNKLLWDAFPDFKIWMEQWYEPVVLARSGNVVIGDFIYAHMKMVSSGQGGEIISVTDQDDNALDTEDLYESDLPLTTTGNPVVIKVPAATTSIKMHVNQPGASGSGSIDVIAYSDIQTNDSFGFSAGGGEGDLELNVQLTKGTLLLIVNCS